MLLHAAGLYFRAFYGVPDAVRAPNGEPINAVRGLLDTIARLTTEFEPTEIVACWDDDWRPQRRVDLIPTYKTHRVASSPTSSPPASPPPATDADPTIEDVPALLSPQVSVIREVLDALGIPIAPTVVNVVRELDLPAFDARIRPGTPTQIAEFERLSEEWGLSSSMTRARAALAARG